jgi:hypothetical protein
MAITLHGSTASPADNGSSTATQITLTPPSAMQAGDLVYVAVMQRGTATFSVGVTGGQSWSSNTRQNVSAALSHQTFYTVFDGSWTANPRFDFSAGTNTSAIMLVFRPSAGYTMELDVAETLGTFTAGSSPFTKTITGITRHASQNSVAIAFWSSVDDNTWGSLSGAGWSKTSLTAQYRNLAGSDTSATFAYSIGTGATGDVSQDQATLGGDQGGTGIIAFRETPRTSPYRVQSAFVDPADPATATFGSTPVEGNLLIATATERSGTAHASYTISGSGWTKAFGRDVSLGDSTYRRSMAVWYKLAGASEPTAITIDNGTANGKKVQIQEFAAAAGTKIGSLLDSASNDNGNTSNAGSLSVGTTGSTSGHQLVIGVMGVKRNASSASYTSSWSDGLADSLDSVHASTSSQDILSAWDETDVTGTKTSTATMSTAISNDGLIGGILAFEIVGIAQAAYRFYEDGTETGSTAIDAQNTNITRDVTSDSNLQLRVRLQNPVASAFDSTDDYQLQYELNDSGHWRDVTSGGVSTILDPNGVWTDDANAFDGSTATAATIPYNTEGSTTSNYLYGKGTTAPSTGASITQVRARLDDGTGYGSYVTLSAPTGGWTWTKVQDLSVYTYLRNAGSGYYDFGSSVYFQSELLGTASSNAAANSGTRSLTNVQVEVTAGSATSYDFDALTNVGLEVTPHSSASLTDGNATTNRLGSGTGSFVAGEISEDGLVDNHQLTASNYTEHLYSLTLVSSALANNDTIDFRVLKNGDSTAMTYTVTPRITASKGSGTTVTPGAASLTLSTFAATVTATANVTVTPGVASLTTSRFAPTVTASDNKSVTPGAASLTTSTFAPSVTVSANQSVTPGTASLTTSTFAPTITVSDNQLVTPTTASLTLTAFAPTVTATANQSVTPGTASLTLTAYAPTVTLAIIVTPGTGSLTTSSFAPTVTATDSLVVTPSTASLSLTAFAPTVALSDNKLVTPATASLSLTGYAPNITVSDNQSVTPTTASLTLTTFAPVIVSGTVLTPTTASLTTTQFAPVVLATDNKSVTPGTGSLTTTTYAPSVAISDHKLVTPTTATLTTSMFAPTVTASDNKSVTPGTASLSLSSFAPSVTATNNQTVTPATASLTTSMFAPTVTATANQTVTPTTASLTLTTFEPTVTATGATVLTPDTATLTLSTFAPSVTASDNKLVTPTTASLTTSTFSPTVATTDNQLVTPDTASLTTSTFAPSVSLGIVVTPVTASLTLSSFAPDVSFTASAYVTPGVLSLVLTAFPPTTVLGYQSVPIGEVDGSVAWAVAGGDASTFEGGDSDTAATWVTGNADNAVYTAGDQL